MPNSMRRRQARRGFFADVSRRLSRLFRQRIFWGVTAFGNGLVFLGATAFHHAEVGRNPYVHDFLDSLFWSFSTVTAVGYGNLVPMTSAGKVVGIALMILGTLFLWSYMALFVGAILSPDLVKLEQDVRELEMDLSNLQGIRDESHGERNGKPS